MGIGAAEMPGGRGEEQRQLPLPPGPRGVEEKAPGDVRRTDISNPSRSCWGHSDYLLSSEGMPQKATCENIPALRTESLARPLGLLPL